MEGSILKKHIQQGSQIVLPLLLGVVILIWTYHDFNFSKVKDVILHDMDRGWMIISLIFGVLAQVFRGWRWLLTLEPLNEYPKRVNCVNAVFLSYGANLVIPRIGEVSRCGVLKKYDGVSFPKALGTVVTERLVDSICIAFITVVTLLLQSSVFSRFFEQTGTNMGFVRSLFASTNFFITLTCLFAIALLLFMLIRKLSVYSQLRRIVSEIWQGCISLRYVRRKCLFTAYTVGIWVSYFFHFYLTFFAFDFTADLGIVAALVMFVVGSIAVIVPTPNGAGPWHFAIITMMMMYGVSKENAGVFALLVHGIQTFLLILLGIYSLVALPLMNKQRREL